MRVTQNMIVNRFLQDLTANQRRLFDLQGQVSSGVRLERPSDDPVAVSRVMRFDSEDVSVDRFLANAREARDWLGATDAALAEAQNVLARARELAVRSATDSLATLDRQAIADELDVLIQHLVDVANTSYKGRFLFSGTATTTVPIQPAPPPTYYTYAGNTGALQRQIGADVTLQVNVTGDQAFLPAVNALVSIRQDVLAGNAANLSTTGLANLDAAIDGLLRIRSQVGARMNRAEWAAERLDEISFQIEGLRSEIRDADIARVLVDLRAAEVTLQTSLAASARMFQTSLVHFLD